jgi:hypothetical protein
VFAPGDRRTGRRVRHRPGQDCRKLTEESKDAAIRKRVLKEGSGRPARIAKDRRSVPDPEHLSTVREISVVQQKLRILLMPGRRPASSCSSARCWCASAGQAGHLTTSCRRGGHTNKLTAEQDEQVIPRFPTRFDVRPTKGVDPAERPYNLNEYDVLIAFDPDWSELSAQQSEGPGAVGAGGRRRADLVAGPVNRSSSPGSRGRAARPASRRPAGAAGRQRRHQHPPGAEDPAPAVPETPRPSSARTF